MKIIIVIVIAVLMSLHLKAQSVKDGIVYDTLTTIENEDFIISEAIITYRSEGIGIFEIFGIEIKAVARAKRDLSVLITKIWTGCYLNDEMLAAKDWGGIRYTEYKMNQGKNFRMGIAGEYIFNKEYTERTLKMRWNCEENPAKHIVRGFVMEYFIGRFRKYLVIDKFKIIPKFKMDEYIDYRKEILNKINK